MSGTVSTRLTPMLYPGWKRRELRIRAGQQADAATISGHAGEDHRHSAEGPSVPPIQSDAFIQRASECGSGILLADTGLMVCVAQLCFVGLPAGGSNNLTDRRWPAGRCSF